VRSGSSSGTLTLTLLDSCVAMLCRERPEFGSCYEDSDLLFCWENGLAVHPDTVTRRFRKLMESAGLPKINLHIARHSYASARQDAQRSTGTRLALQP
jgi:site-specific recombinase XerD